jgi:acetyl-CoA C-acetyltransferase
VEPHVAVVGVGHTGCVPISSGVSYKELMYDAARLAYADAGIDPRTDVDSFVCVSEDLDEGTSIFDEYVPDQLGAARRPVHTLAADGLAAVGAAFMLIRSGIAGVVVVEGHRKSSDSLTPGRVERFALDPVFERPIGVPAVAVAGLEMDRFLRTSGASERDCAEVVSQSRRNALGNPRAAYRTQLGVDEVLESPPLFSPLVEAEAARPADAAVVVVLAATGRAGVPARSVGVTGVGWATGGSSLGSRDWDRPGYVAGAAAMAYGQAGTSEFDLAEIDDRFAYKQLQHAEALGLRDGVVNRSGGALGEGEIGDATGLSRLVACVEQLRGEAGPMQVEGARTAVAQSWRGVPSTSSAVVTLQGPER